MSNELKTSTTQPSSTPYQLRMCYRITWAMSSSLDNTTSSRPYQLHMCYRPTWAMSSRPRQHNPALHHTSCVCVIDPHEQWAQDLDNTTSSAPYQLHMCYRPTWAMSSRPRQHNPALHHTSCVCVIDPHEQWAQDLDNTTQLCTITAAYVL